MATQVKERRDRRFDPTNGRDDLNLAEFPLFCVTKPEDMDKLTIVSEVTGNHSETGQVITRKRKIASTEEYGLPRGLDGDVLLALIAIGHQTHRFEKKRVYFSRHQLLEFMRWPTNDHYYRRLTHSLHVWQGTSFHYENWWDAQKSEFRDTGFGVIQDFSIVSSKPKKGQTELALSYVTFADKFLEEFIQGGWGKEFNPQPVFALNSDAAKAAFRFFDKRLREGRRNDFELYQFATQHVGIKGVDKKGKRIPPARLRQRLARPLAEVEETGMILPEDDDHRYSKRNGKHWVSFVRGEQSPESNPLLRQLLDYGVSQHTAKKWLREAEFDNEHITSMLELVAFLIEEGSSKAPNDTARFLHAAITKGYSLPTGFRTKAERERIAKAKQAKHRQKRLDLDNRERELKEDKIRAAQEVKAVEEYRSRLSQVEQEEFDHQIIENSDGFYRRFLLEYLNDRSQVLGIGASIYKQEAAKIINEREAASTK